MFLPTEVAGSTLHVCNAALFNLKTLDPAPPCPTVERLLSVRGGMIRHSRALILLYRRQTVTYQHSQNGLKPPVV